MPRRNPILVGVISDTHGLLRPEALAALQGVDQILHAGDVGGADVIEALRKIAPVTAVRGNNDVEAWAKALPERITVTIGGFAIHLLHDVAELDPNIHAHAVIAGHSHRPKIEMRDDVLFFNPGSAGPRRFTLPISLGRLRIARTLEPELIELTPAPSRGAGI